MERKFSILVAVVAVSAALVAPSAFAASDDEATTTSVDVAQELTVDVAPDTLTYDINPGDYNDTSERQYTGIEVENTGSQNISDVYASVSNPADRPFGTGRVKEYDAGNFIQLQVTDEVPGTAAQTRSNGYHYVDRREFNESNELSYFKQNDETNGHYGRFRTGNESFFWEITDANAGCSGGSSDLLVGKQSKTQDRVGDVDFTDTSNFRRYDVVSASSSTYGVAPQVQVDTFSGNKNYTVLTKCNGLDSTQTQWTKWDAEGPNGNTIEYVNRTNPGGLPIVDSNSNIQELKPGEHFSLLTRISVPNAVAQGEVSDGDVTIVITNDDVSSNDEGI